MKIKTIANDLTDILEHDGEVNNFLSSINALKVEHFIVQQSIAIAVSSFRGSNSGTYNPDIVTVITYEELTSTAEKE